MLDLNPDHVRNLFYTSIAGIGGALGYIYRETRAGRMVRLTRVLLSAMLAAFIGFHMILVYQSLELPEPIIGALNGLTAILGVEFALFVFEKIAFKYLGLGNQDERIVKILIESGWTPPSDTRGSILPEGIKSVGTPEGEQAAHKSGDGAS